MSRKALSMLFVDGSPTRKLNRLVSRRPRHGKFWCLCDLNHVAQGEKCSVCGSRGDAKNSMKPKENR